jgi:Na+/glutamate symporter
MHQILIITFIFYAVNFKIHHKNSIQIIGFILFTLCATGYAIFQASSITNTIKDPESNPGSTLNFADTQQKSIMLSLLLVVPIIMAFFDLVYIISGYKLYQEFGWKIYKTIGADPEIRGWQTQSYYSSLFK